ncbi:MAG: DUF5329 family protein [Verrucomicrobiota bacterium]
MGKILLVLLCIFSLELAAAPQSDSRAVIEKLLKKVETSDCTFIRNGSNHTGKEAATHMRRKYEHFKHKIKTPEDFIEKCASRSELSGKEYSVKLPEGKVMSCKKWMTEELKQLQAADKITIR